MRSMTVDEIRESYLSFFESKGHLRLQSASLVPNNDNSLLLINSGMAPLKPYFTGRETPPSKRVTSCQKCVRTVDIENVGKTVRHGTFFEMLGNFSFGDYFKNEIIPWAWEYVTKVLEIPEDRLYISVYKDDKEAYDIWHDVIGLDDSKIFPMGEEDNFWEVGLGPCGPCSEIYYDRGEKYGCGSETCTVGCDCDRYMEFWNLVFTQYNKEVDGSHSDLDHPNIDTGMGLERMATILQDTDSIFDIDTSKCIRDKICEVLNVSYNTSQETDYCIRVITDHIRSATFIVGDGVLPFNEGRGYVLRRLISRIVRKGDILGAKENFLPKVIETVIDVYKDSYPELFEKKEVILKIITLEAERINDNFVKYIEILRDFAKKLKNDKINVLKGEEAFRLYDTYGVPLDMLQEILEEEGLSVDEEKFLEMMEGQRERARKAREEFGYLGVSEEIYDSLNFEKPTEFLGYESLEVNGAKILAIIADDEVVDVAAKRQKVSIILDKTTFYAEMGGQDGDEGVLESANALVKILDCKKVSKGMFAHLGEVVEGSIKTGDSVACKVDKEIRLATERNHTGTHILQKALRDVLGNHVQQAGSKVTKDGLRFDFIHFNRLSEEEIIKVENIVNDKILEGLNVNISEMPVDDAKKLGAMALFGEKYNDLVRVVDVSNFSLELCGGTHVKNTAQIGTFKIINDTSISAGVRRIEAITGKNTINYYRNLSKRMDDVQEILRVVPENFLSQIQKLMEDSRNLQSEMTRLKSRLSSDFVEKLLESEEVINGVSIFLIQVASVDASALRDIGDKIKDRFKISALLLIGSDDEKVTMISMATDAAVDRGINAGKIVKETIGLLEGKGGGRPNMAQAGGKDPSRIGEALSKAHEIVVEQLS